MSSLRPVEDTPLARFAALVAQAEAIGGTLDVADTPAALGDVERLRMGLRRRLFGAPRAPEPAGRLLTAQEAADRLQITVPQLYRWKDCPFRVRVSEGCTRFSERGIERFIRSNEGR